jgi:hypothetical protein
VVQGCRAGRALAHPKAQFRKAPLVLENWVTTSAFTGEKNWDFSRDFAGYSYSAGTA